MKTKLLFTHALSPLHAGTGQGIGVIDLPIARERATGLPFLPGSSVKGTLRDACPDAKRNKFFGPDAKDINAAEYASVLQFSDQRLLLFPVRSLVGTFAWVTSPYILRRFKRDANDAKSNSINLNVPEPTQTQCFITNVASEKAISHQGKVYLEDLDLDAIENADTANWASKLAEQIFPDIEWQKFLRGRFCILSDEAMNFLVETATEVSARIRLEDETKTVVDGGLWYEEALPCESVLYGIVSANPITAAGATPDEAITEVTNLIHKPIQFGGKATVGRGICQLRFSKEAA